MPKHGANARTRAAVGAASRPRCGASSRGAPRAPCAATGRTGASRDPRGKLVADGDAADAVAVGVEPRREDRDAEASRLDREDAAADAALRGQARTGTAIRRRSRTCRRSPSPTRTLSTYSRGDRALAGDGIHAAVCERRADQREIAAGDADRALPEIGIERRRRLVGQDGEVAQHPADRAIAVARSRSRSDRRARRRRARGRHSAKTRRGCARSLLDGGAAGAGRTRRLHRH